MNVLREGLLLAREQYSRIVCGSPLLFTFACRPVLVSVWHGYMEPENCNDIMPSHGTPE
jgi:hypothetical protein